MTEQEFIDSFNDLDHLMWIYYRDGFFKQEIYDRLFALSENIKIKVINKFFAERKLSQINDDSINSIETLKAENERLRSELKEARDLVEYYKESCEFLQKDKQNLREANESVWKLLDRMFEKCQS